MLSSGTRRMSATTTTMNQFAAAESSTLLRARTAHRNRRTQQAHCHKMGLTLLVLGLWMNSIDTINGKLSYCIEIFD